MQDQHLVKHAVIGITDDGQKDVHGVEVFLNRLVDRVRTCGFQEISVLNLWTDG